ncbi:hypothetical protein BGX28_007292 [Mortierella sp. GBA30]|nr:hypothetical protein BGX28_007292 [Mortierella sp. GBA30]
MALPFVREVENLERYSLARVNAGVFCNVVVGPRLKSLQSTTPLPQDTAQWIELLRTPLTWLIKKHPVLSVVIGDHLSTKPVFLRMPSVDLASVIRVTAIEELRDIAMVLEHEHATPFDCANHKVPLWRLIVVEVKNDGSFYLLYSFQHTIGDGRSAMALTEELVERLNVQKDESPLSSAEQPCSTIVSSPDAPLDLPMERRMKCKPSMGTLLKELTMALFLPPSLKKMIEKKYWSGEHHATFDVPHETQVGAWYLSQDETSQVLKAAKAHNNTVQSVLYAASMFAMKSVFLSGVPTTSDTDDEKCTTRGPTTTKDALSFGTPISTRDFVSPPIPREDLGCYTSELITKNVQIQLASNFWDLALSYRKEILEGTQTAKGREALCEYVGLLAYLPNNKPGDWEDYTKNLIKKEQHGRQVSLKISNVGRAWDQPSTATTPLAFKVQEAIFSQSASTTCCAVTSGAATANGVLSITGTWQKSTFSSRDRPEFFMKEFKRILLEATQQPGKTVYSFCEALLSSSRVAN